MIPLSAGYTLPLFGPGTYLIFGIVFAPIYIMIISWFVGDPRDIKPQLLGVSYLVALTTSLWGGLFVFTIIIKFVFF